MTPKKRTIAVLKYINSIESTKSKYLNNASENIVSTIYSVYKEVINKLSPGHHILNNTVGPIKAHVLLQENTNYVLPEKYRKLITLISFYYHQKNRKFLLPFVNVIIERSKNLFDA